MANVNAFLKKYKLKWLLMILIFILILVQLIYYGNVKIEKYIEVAEETQIKASQTTVPDGYIGIYNAEDLANIANNLSGNYILMSNIDMADVAYEIIGPSATDPFKGVFDGNYYTISNLSISSKQKVL